MTFDLPPIYKFKVEARSTSPCGIEAHARHHTIMIDEPESQGGADNAATPLETMLSSYLGCLNVIANLIADEMGIELKDLSMELNADFDTDGVGTTTPTNLPFPHIVLTMNVTTDASEQKLEILKKDIQKRCPVTVLFAKAGTKITPVWNVTKSSATVGN